MILERFLKCFNSFLRVKLDTAAFPKFMRMCLCKQENVYTYLSEKLVHVQMSCVRHFLYPELSILKTFDAVGSIDKTLHCLPIKLLP